MADTSDLKSDVAKREGSSPSSGTNMLTAQLILQIILASFQLATELTKDVPVDIKVKIWEQHFKDLEFWRALLAKIPNLER